MPPRTLGSANPANRPVVDTTATVTQLSARQSAATTTAAPPPPQSIAPPAAAPAGRRRVVGGDGLPPGDPSVDDLGGGGFKRKRDDEWDNLSANGGRKENGKPGGGYYDFDLYVNKIVEWHFGVIVSFRVNDWDQDTGRSGEHHWRPIEWAQQMHRKTLDRRLASNPDAEDRLKAERAYKFWRRELVTLYDGSGFPEDRWPVTASGAPVPPWDEFFVHQCGDGVFVPVMFRATVVVEPARQNFPPKFVALARIDAEGSVVQAPLPYQLPPGLAASFRWHILETKALSNKATVEIIDCDSVRMGHLNLPTYKDI